MAADKEGGRRRDRDPILTVGFVVLILAFASVIGIFVHDHYIKDNSGPPAGTGNLVKVDYTGSYYGYYYEDGAAVFDTSEYGIASNDDYAKSFEFTMRSESMYSPISFTIGGSDSYLPMFMNAVIGKKAGETAKVIIPPAEGYGQLTADQVARHDLTGNEMDRIEVISLETFKTLYGISDPKGNMQNLNSPYGWPADANVNGSLVTIFHKPVDGETYTMNGDVSIKVYGSDSEKVKFDYVIAFRFVSPEKFVYPGDTTESFKNVALCKIVIDNKEKFIAAYDGADEFVTKDTDERTGMYLFFVITVVSIS